MVPILFTKDVFEPVCSDVKFTVWNHNYFFTNLILCKLAIIMALIFQICYSFNM